MCFATDMDGSSLTGQCAMAFDRSKCVSNSSKGIRLTQYQDFKGVAFSTIAGEKAQATVEAAFALPIIMLLLLMLLQPGIVLYDRMVMAGAAAEGCRLLSTASPSDSSICEDFIRRRLSAIPQIDIFHIHGGGCSYEVNLSGCEADQTVEVTISNRLKPLPLLDITMSLAGMTDPSGSIDITVSSSADTQPSWVEDSQYGTDPGNWVGI